MREVDNAKALKHRHVVELRAGGVSAGIPFLAFEFCNGGTVFDLLKARGGILAPKDAVEIILQVLEGLEYAHGVELPAVRLANGDFAAARGLVHRDIKPQNMLLHNSEGEWVAKLSDYGLAKAYELAGKSGITGTGEIAGTIPFMPRQQVREFKYAKPTVDLWATAASLYFMLCGWPPRNLSGSDDVISEILANDAVPILQRSPTIPRHLAQAVDFALIEDPKINVSTAADLKRQLEAARDADGF